MVHISYVLKCYVFNTVCSFVCSRFVLDVAMINTYVICGLIFTNQEMTFVIISALRIQQQILLK